MSIASRVDSYLKTRVTAPRQVQVTAPAGPNVSQPPRRWGTGYMPPGQPIQPIVNQWSTADEPRNFDYVPSINATISPRIAYGLMSFAQIKAYAETVPEIGRCRRLITNELSAFYPQLKDDQGNLANDEYPELRWMVTRPDGKLAWPVWLSRSLKNILIYDAWGLWRMRHGSRTVGLRVIDGSTIFPIIDEYGEQPAAPEPAYSQVIKGMPYKWMSAAQFWYKPHNLREDVPYGLTAIEDALSAVEVLAAYWQWVKSFYTDGNMPGDRLVAPENWSWEQVIQWEEARNAKMEGNIPEMRKEQWYPNGTGQIQRPTGSADAQERKEDYMTAFEALSFAFGIPMSEWGDAPGEGLGGKGYQDKMETALFRMCIGPYKNYIETPFNEILTEMGYSDITFELSFPSDTIDPDQEEEKTIKRWQAGLVRRDEARENLELEPIGGDEGDLIITPTGAPTEQAGGMPTPGGTIPVAGSFQARGAIPVSGGGRIKVNGKIPVNGVIAVNKRDDPLLKHCGLCEEDDALFGVVVSRNRPLAFPSHSTNDLEVVAISDEAVGVRPAVWRPESGESAEQREIVGGPLFPREEAVYLLDRIMQFYLVPVCYVTEVDGQAGVVCHYVKGRDGQAAEDYAPEWIERAGILDYISGQLDRNPGNWTTHPEEDDRPVLIDNGMSFAGFWSGLKCPFANYILRHGISQDGQDAVFTALNDEALWVDITELVGAGPAQAARQRAAQLLEQTEAVNA